MSSFDRKKIRESLLVDKHSVFRYFVLRVENKALESGTKQCSFHVHGGQVKSKAFSRWRSSSAI